VNREHGPVWVIAEQLNGQLLPVSLQLIGKARELADGLGTRLDAVLLGEKGTGLYGQLIAAGADYIYAGDNNCFREYHPQIYTATLVDLLQKYNPDIVLLGSTFMGRELAPLLAVKLGTGLTAHCVELVLDQEMNMVQKIPAYGGLMSIVCPSRRPQMATVAQGVFQMPSLDKNRIGKIMTVEPPEEIISRLEILEIIRQERIGVNLESARTVVAGGAGAGDLAGWEKIVELANVLDAGLGSTRPVVDAGWAGIETMIGQSGKMVKPELYIGVGLSGEQQHMIGVTGAKVMVAINNDSKSPVFKKVDMGVVADCREFLPILIDKLKKYKKKG
jgi:electron transfer flavoprotein alpha subunit